MHLLFKLIGTGVVAAVLVLLPLPFAAVLVLGSIVLVLALIDPIWALFVVVLAVPVQDIILLPGGISLVQAALLLALGTWALRVMATPEHPVKGGAVFPVLLLLLWALALASLATPYSRTEALKETIRWASVALVYLITLNSVAAGNAASWRAGGLIACLLLAPASNALLGLWQFATGSAPVSFLIEDEFARSYGTIGQPNSFAGYMNMGWPLAVAVAGGAAWALVRPYTGNLPAAGTIRREPPAWVALALLAGAGAAALLLLAALLASFSRGGWVGAMGGAGGMMLAILLLLPGGFWRSRAWQWLGLAAVGGVLLVLLGVGGVLPNALTERVASIATNLRLFDVRTVEATPENFAVVERMAQIQAAWAMFTDHPLTGVGPGNYTRAYEGQAGFAHQPYLLHPWYDSRGHAHNYYLHSAAETGVIGLAAYLALLGAVVLQAYRSLRCVQGWFWLGIVIGGCGIIATVAAHNLFENLHVLNMGVQLGAIWGLLAAAEQRMKHRTYKE